MYGHLTKTRTGYELTICNSMRPVGGVTVAVRDKRQAREICTKHRATPWNF
jgi:hypothetical protein